MIISFTPKLKNNLEEIKLKNPKLFKKIQKQLKLFMLDPKYPSLKTHKLEGRLNDSWSISIEGNIRMLYHTEGEEVLFSLIGTHDEVYKK